ncbi:hypothetical protein CMUS01_12723 [Colletotrichum musicola]|uniref:AAA+ ATPase domain-containing protein n=1 Tax=Colletotrichum musicola TaxID=2175873 RepID=A0A8H6JJV1_9PEZI|nr:hypothetical protein CMUS01_12723 [Colletotrichum musicola]
MATETSGASHSGPPDVLSLSSVIKALGPKGTSATSPAPTEAAISEQPAEEGSDCSAQTLYEGPPKCRCCTNWVEESPDDLRIPVEEQLDVKQKALVIRMGKSHSDGNPLSLHSIVVQSASLKKTLGEVFEGFEGITTSLKKLVFKAPFHPFYYRWSTLQQILEKQKKLEPDAGKYTQLLYNILEKELRDVMAEIKDLLDNKVMTYSLLWALFEPGGLVVTTEEQDERFFIAHRCAYNAKEGYLGVHAKFVDWNGERFGYSDESLCICEYHGTRPITDLGVYPARFHSSIEASKQKAMERGRRFRDLRGFHYKAYSGLVRARSGRKEVQRNCDGRIVIDASAYYHEKPDARQGLATLTSRSIAPRISVTDNQHKGSPNPTAGEYAYYPAPRISAADDQYREHELTDEQLLLCSTRVRGYTLKMKHWVEFRVNGISDIVFNETAFDTLILPQGYKQLVLSFIGGSKMSGFDDVIEGKGLGIIMLLVGNPGTGKTLTAEALADKLQKPLYILSAGELGQDARDVEPRLSEILELTTKWDAVLLFDELLEYHRGILLMTTNRADSIDRAFLSRIHLTLHYPDLAPEAKERLWRRFTDSTTNTLLDEDFAKLAMLPTNGREVKNIIKVATSAANVGTVAKSAMPVEGVHRSLTMHRVGPVHAIPVQHHAPADSTGPPPNDAGSAANHTMIDALKEHPTLRKLAEGAGNATSPGRELDKPITYEEDTPAHKVILAVLLVAMANEVFQALIQLVEIAFN